MSDLIERDKVMNILEDMDVGIIPYAHARKYAQITIDHIRKQIENIPSARPKGEWIIHEHGFWTFVNDKGERDGWIPDYECNLCGSRGWKYADVMNFCPNCGASMREREGE